MEFEQPIWAMIANKTAKNEAISLQFYIMAEAFTLALILIFAIGSSIILLALCAPLFKQNCGAEPVQESVIVSPSPQTTVSNVEKNNAFIVALPRGVAVAIAV